MFNLPVVTLGWAKPGWAKPKPPF